MSASAAPDASAEGRGPRADRGVVAFLRLAGRIALFILLVGVLGIVAYAFLGALGRAGAPVLAERLRGWQFGELAGALGATAVMLRWVDRRPWSFVALGGADARPGLLAEGWLVGTLAIGVPSLLLALVGWLDWAPSTPGSWVAGALAAAAILVPAALVEELLMRGYPFAVLRERFGVWPAIAATSVIFGLMHLGNPSVTARSIALVMLAGVFLGLVVVVTRSLWAAWVAHFAWNFTLAALLHTPVSGLPLARPDYQLLDAGPDWATGGSWGPEGGAGAALGMLASMGYLSWRLRRRGTTDRSA